MTSIIPQKRCSKCKLEFPATTEYFHIESNGKYGLHSRCKDCRKRPKAERSKPAIKPSRILEDGSVEITLTRGNVAIIDPIDSDLAAFNWFGHYCRKNIYVRRNVSNEDKIQLHINIHRVIMARVLNRELKDDEIIDHINGNGLDNQRRNLRLATSQQNRHNSRQMSTNTSGLRGAYYRKDNKRWRSLIHINGKYIQLGNFDTAEEAHKAYCEAAKKYHGEFARFE